MIASAKRVRMRSFKTGYALPLSQDPISMWLLVVIGVLIIGMLLTVISAFLGGVFDFSRRPRKFEEQQILLAQSSVSSDATDENYGNLVIVLAQAGRFTEAKEQLQAAREMKIDPTRAQALTYAQANIAQLEGDTAQATLLYQKVVADLKAAYDIELKSDEEPNWAKAYGLHDNYWLSILALANIAQENNDYTLALEHLNLYLSGNANAAGVYIDRGNVKLKLDDAKGAAKDFKKALTFLPDNQEALDGLSQAKDEDVK